MKIRGRLIVAFLIMTLFPFAMSTLCVNFILEKQLGILEASYHLDSDEYNPYGFMMDPVQLLYNITMREYDLLVQIADNNPDRFHDSSYLQEIDNSLEKRDSFLIVYQSGRNLFVGNQNLYQKMSPLPPFRLYEDGANRMIYIDQKNSMLIKEKDFYFSDGSEGQLFLATDLSRLLPRWKNSIQELIISFLLIILATALLLLVWIYQSIIHPLNILRIATMQIGAGHLEQPVRVLSSDEIGELCRDFEEMRIRLKSMVEERIQYEEDTREMMSSISHDLKTPLTAIKGYAEGLLDGVAHTPDKQEKYLHTIYSKANDMTHLVDQLSLFAKVEQNTLSYHFISLNLQDYFSDCMSDLSLDLETYGMTLSFFNTVSPDTKIFADPEQLKRVIYNIAGNAGKYLDHTPATLHVRIEDLPVEPDIPPLYRQINKDGTDVTPRPKPDEFVKIQIEDEGPGISSQDLPFIFDRFYRADASRNSSRGGSGLGLAIVKKIISDHGGRVWAESIEGVGTSIFFTLKKVPKD